MKYVLLAPLANNVSISIEQLCEALSDRFSDWPLVSVGLNSDREIGGKYVELLLGNWSLHVHLEDGPHVIEESRELAASYAQGRAEMRMIAECERRITVDSDEDQAMAYFNCYAIVCETVEAVGGIALFDPAREEFID